MISAEQFKLLLPLACTWAHQQETHILNNGVALDEDQQIDAFLVGVKNPTKVRLLKVNQIPTPDLPALATAVKVVGLLSPNTIGVTFRHGIYIRADCWHQRKLVVHELAHTMQYERMGGIQAFLEVYLQECLTYGYPFGNLEQEAKQLENKICT